MAKQNSFIARQHALQIECFNAGLDCGQQRIIDMMSLVLRDPEIMGKDTFGKDRLLKVVQGIKDYIEKYDPAWQKDADTDYYREKLDGALKEAYGELQDPFDKRYEFAPEFNYKTGRWK